MSADLPTLRSAGVLADIDVHLARTLGTLVSDDSDRLALAIALTSRALRHGHVCLDLQRVDATRFVDDLGATYVVDLPPRSPWLLEIAGSPLVGDGVRETPLVLDETGRLYFARYHRYQTQLAQALHQRVMVRLAPPQREVLRADLERLFAPAPGFSADPRQRLAAAVACTRALTVITGGPGTGKTSTVVRILALLQAQAFARGQRALRIRLLAPTGKAAARLAESIESARASLPISEELRAAIPSEATTIHRALGSLPRTPTRFRHHAALPLPADVVLVDEASMVDLALMAKLVDAVPPHARLVLLGDRNQLASVEAGAILGDVCDRDRDHRISRVFARELADTTGEVVPQDMLADDVPPLGDCIVELRRSFRFEAAPGIGRLAEAINRGDRDGVRAALGEPCSAPAAAESQRDVVLVPLAEHEDPTAQLGALVRGELAGYLHTPDAAARLDALGRLRVLGVHRRGRHGVERLNEAVETILGLHTGSRGEDPFYDGRPILVTRNDHLLRLYNGDVGIVHAPPGTRARVLFSGPTGLRAIAPNRLPPHETVFAMTVHKSQGSEFDQVVLVLPPALSPLLTRELLYTAITRARRRVVILGRADVVAQAVERRIERASGLRDALWAPP